jgi:hypothetical protein
MRTGKDTTHDLQVLFRIFAVYTSGDPDGAGVSRVLRQRRVHDYML